MKARRLLLLALQTNRAAAWQDGVWLGKCLHCRRKIRLTETGRGLDAVTLEHIVPRSWFGQRAAADLCALAGDAPDHPRNLAVACPHCNHLKGSRQDQRGPQDARAREVVAALLEKRLAEWQPTGRPRG